MTTRLGTDLALAYFKVGLVIGLALGVHADLIRLLTERLAFDARRSAFGAHGGLALKRAHLDAARHRIGDIAVGPSHATDKAAARLGARLHNQVFAAFGARTDLGVRGYGIADRVAQLLRMLEQLVEHASEQRT